MPGIDLGQSRSRQRPSSLCYLFGPRPLLLTEEIFIEHSLFGGEGRTLYFGDYTQPFSEISPGSILGSFLAGLEGLDWMPGSNLDQSYAMQTTTLSLYSVKHLFCTLYIEFTESNWTGP